MMKSVLCRTRPTLTAVERILAIRVVSLVSSYYELIPYALCLQTHMAQHIQNPATIVDASRMHHGTKLNICMHATCLMHYGH